jgi:hypothetical protein
MASYKKWGIETMKVDKMRKGSSGDDGASVLISDFAMKFCWKCLSSAVPEPTIVGDQNKLEVTMMSTSA